nr:hypothetical protein [Pseudomonas paraeruginosa]
MLELFFSVTNQLIKGLELIQQTVTDTEEYALPPASFEQFGQKVRSPSHILESGLATCFDLSLLFCAALEQAGLNPLLIFTRGHAFSGFWLKAEEFSNSTVDDISVLIERR